MMQNSQAETPLLSVVTITYNHERWIAKTIEGVLAQKVDFPIEYIIAEDCSTDRTREICKTYYERFPYIINLLPLEQNVGAVKNEARAMAAVRGKYVAFCEGDDYWIDENKLQKQVDFMESHPDYSCCFHRVYQNDILSDKIIPDHSESYFNVRDVEGVELSLKQFVSGELCVMPLSMVYRTELLSQSVADKYGDYWRDCHQIYNLLKRGKGYLFSFFGGVRHLHSGGVYNGLSEEGHVLTDVAVDRQWYLVDGCDDLVKHEYENSLRYAYRYYMKKKLKSKTFGYSFELLKLNKHFLSFVKRLVFVVIS